MDFPRVEKAGGSVWKQTCRNVEYYVENSEKGSRIHTSRQFYAHPKNQDEQRGDRVLNRFSTRLSTRCGKVDRQSTGVWRTMLWAVQKRWKTSLKINFLKFWGFLRDRAPLQAARGGFQKFLTWGAGVKPLHNRQFPLISLISSSISARNTGFCAIRFSTLSSEDRMVVWSRLKILPILGRDISVTVRSR